MGNKIIRSFKRAASTVPAYGQILAENGIKPENIRTIADFKKIPILEKKDLFGKYSLKDLCTPKAINNLATAIVTSGTSGSFACGIVTKKEQGGQRRTIDAYLNIFFSAHKVKTIIINALPMGVSFASSYPVIPTSVRSDIAWHVIKNFGQTSDQIIIITDPNFAKKMVEEGKKNIFFGAEGKLKFIIGGDWSPASYYDYINQSINARENRIYGNYGITEIGLNVGFSENSLYAIRKEMQNNKNLQKAVFGQEVKTAPALFAYMPSRTYIEKIHPDFPFSELAFTTLSKTSMPFIRYSTGDCGTIIDLKSLNKILIGQGKKDLCFKPPFLVNLSIIALSGRKSNTVCLADEDLSAEDVKQVIYSEKEIAENLTGNFRLSAENSCFKITMQLMPGKKASQDFIGQMQKAFEKTSGSISLKICEYNDFPYNMALDYESKWAYTKT